MKEYFPCKVIDIKGCVWNDFFSFVLSEFCIQLIWRRFSLMERVARQPLLGPLPWCPVMRPSPCGSSEDWPPVNGIYRCPDLQVIGYLLTRDKRPAGWLDLFVSTSLEEKQVWKFSVIKIEKLKVHHYTKFFHSSFQAKFLSTFDDVPEVLGSWFL